MLEVNLLDGENQDAERKNRKTINPQTGEITSKKGLKEQLDDAANQIDELNATIERMKNAENSTEFPPAEEIAEAFRNLVPEWIDSLSNPEPMKKLVDRFTNYIKGLPIQHILSKINAEVVNAGLAGGLLQINSMESPEEEKQKARVAFARIFRNLVKDHGGKKEEKSTDEQKYDEQVDALKTHFPQLSDQQIRDFIIYFWSFPCW